MYKIEKFFIALGITPIVLLIAFSIYQATINAMEIKEIKNEIKELRADDEAFKYCFKELGFKIGFEESEKVAAEKADQLYYEEMFSQPKMNLFARNPTIIIPAYDERFIGMHPDLKEYFVRKVPGKEIFSTELNIDFADGTWQLSVDERTSELVKAQFSKDGKFVLVSGMKKGNSIINISREDETYGGSIFVRVEEPEEWYEKLQEEIKLYSRENRR